MASPKNERRSRQRLPMRLPVSFGSPQRSIETAGFTRDLSVNGIFLYTDSQIHLGSELEIVLILPPELTQGEKQWVCCQAAVVRVENATAAGGFGVAAKIESMEILPEILG
jgi:hypothetical protein